MTIAVGRHAALRFGEVADRDGSQSGSPQARWHDEDLCGSTSFESISLHMLQDMNLAILADISWGIVQLEQTCIIPRYASVLALILTAPRRSAADMDEKRMWQFSCLRIHSRHGV